MLQDTTAEQITSNPISTINLNYYNDKLMNMEEENEHYAEFQYDDLGNVTRIRDYYRVPYALNLSWEGRQLKEIKKDLDSFVTYRYNDGGYRTYKKVVTGTNSYDEYFYYLEGDKVIYEQIKHYNNGVETIDKIFYTYDHDGTLISMYLIENWINETSVGKEYFYVRNLQQDIIALADKDGKIVVRYQYDAWGNNIGMKEFDANGTQTSLNLAKINPYRYRGYRYDEETGWYYLQSRYYNPEIGRFINADGLLGKQGDILGHNLYAYVQNNPVMYYDPSGKIGLIIGAIIIIGASVVLKADDPNTVIRDDLKRGKIYPTFREASDRWGQINGPLTGKDGLERGAFIYSKVRADGNRYYYISKTYLGEPDNVVNGFTKGYIRYGVKSLISSYKLEGFIHTHPKTHNWYHDNTSNADDFLMYMPGISKGYVYDVDGRGIIYNQYYSYDYWNYYSSNSKDFWEALDLLINNGHG